MVNLSENNKQKYSVSVVIPTLGEECLVRTIEQLNRGTIVPAEILVCIPEEDVHRVEHLTYPNVRIIKTNCRGQVAQRAVGFQNVKNSMVLQLDDDIFVKEETLNELAKGLDKLGQGSAVGPVYNEFETGRSAYYYEQRKGIAKLLYNIYARVVCGAAWSAVKRMGKIAPSGNNYGVIDSLCGTEPLEAQWLSGGCVMCFREDLIMNNFFPYPGKAYCEDLIHSFWRKQKGMRLWVIPTACCLLSKLIHENEVSLEARKYFVELSGGSKWRFILHNCLSKIKNIFCAP